MLTIDPGDIPGDFSWAQEQLSQVGSCLRVRCKYEPDLPAECYRARREGDEEVVLEASSASGAHYGMLELEERLRCGGLAEAETVVQTPRFPFRAFKFNLPWNAYRWGEVMTQHQEVCREFAFWRRFLDHLARCRFNALTLWNLLPFPWMVRVPGFPEAAVGADAEMEAWEELWSFVFREARRRHLQPIVIWWSIFVPPHLESAWGVDYSSGEYHLGPGQTDERIERYNREATTALINRYDHLAGVGVCMGERMENLNPAEQRAWLEKTVLAGVRAAKRPVLFVQRASLKADSRSVREMIEGADLPGPVILEYKFNWSHAHSTPTLAMTHGAAGGIDEGLWSPPPKHYRVAWMARNEDFFVLRWGEPDFIREHISRNGHPWVGGYFVGSEGHIPAKEVAEQLPEHQRGWRYAFERQWLFSFQWGRLVFDPTTPDTRFAHEFERRYGEGIGPQLVEAFRLGSRMPLRLASFHAATWDYTLYAEGFLTPFASQGRHNGRAFLSVDELIEHPTLEPSWMSIQDFVAGKEPNGRTTPIEMADELEHDAKALDECLDQLRNDTANRPVAYRCELDDLEAWCLLTRYFAQKLRGAVALARFRQEREESSRALAIEQLEQALEIWRSLATLTVSRYNRVPYIERPPHRYRLDFHWQDFLPDVEDDISKVREA
ncbi:MAG: hypothetical protein ACFB21_01595 [Opitutales bacterium]